MKVVSVILWFFLLVSCSGDSEQWHAKNISGLMPDLEFSLVDEQGHAVTEESYRGNTVLMFFGFTNCPDYCPTTLVRLTKALDKLPSDTREEVTILFVSVDPERDSPEVLAGYTDSFSRGVTGLTGSMEDLQELAKRYRTTFSYGTPNARGNYTVSHGKAVYVFDKNGRARLMVLGEQNPTSIARDLQRLTAA